MQATIDIGSNTIRMLIGASHKGNLSPLRYERRITRLAGGMTDDAKLTRASMERSCETLVAFSRLLHNENIPCLRAVGTAALRRAVNRQQFIDEVMDRTGILIEIIDGDEEARLMTAGILSVVSPQPRQAILFDIGGGSTEIVCSDEGRIVFQHSYPIGVVNLTEETPAAKLRKGRIDDVLTHFRRHAPASFLRDPAVELIGTAGTMTTLAAIDLQLTDYDPARVNNHRLKVAWLRQFYPELEPLSLAQREMLPGMEKGRGDVLLAGIEVACALADLVKSEHIIISDAGLLEGVFLDVTGHVNID